MKRILVSPGYNDRTAMKIMKLNDSQLENPNMKSKERKLNFKITDKKVRTNLLKSANENHLKLDVKQNCTNLRFSPGAFLIVAKELINECKDKYKEGTAFQLNDIVVSVNEFKTGTELNNKHFDTKIVLK